MKRRRTFEIGVTRQKRVTPGIEDITLKGFAALEIEDDSDIYQSSAQARAITSPSGSMNAEQLLQQNNSQMSQGLKNFMLTLLLIGICLVIVTYVTDTINWFINSPIAKRIGLSYSQDDVVLLYDKIFDLVIEIARNILVGLFCLHEKVLGHQN